MDLCIVVEDYLEGQLPEQMVLNFPTLDLEALDFAIACYLGHREVVDRNVSLCRQKAERQGAKLAEQSAAPVLARLWGHQGSTSPTTWRPAGTPRAS